MSDHTIDFTKLSEKFSPEELEWRIQRAGKNQKGIWAIVVPYVSNRAIMNRLDDVCLPINWKNRFNHGPDGGVLCGLSIRNVNEWICKWDGADKTDIEPVKGGLSGSMKRAAVQWGIGRYLYSLPSPMYAIIVTSGGNRGQYKDKSSNKFVSFNWNPPALPPDALPDNDKQPKKKATPPKRESTKKTEPTSERDLSPHEKAIALLLESGLIDDVRCKATADWLGASHSDTAQKKLLKEIVQLTLNNADKIKISTLKRNVIAAILTFWIGRRYEASVANTLQKQNFGSKKLSAATKQALINFYDELETHTLKG